jgi:hypothetical protein
MAGVGAFITVRTLLGLVRRSNSQDHVDASAGSGGGGQISSKQFSVVRGRTSS